MANKDISRRQFLKGSGAVGLGAAAAALFGVPFLTGCSSKETIATDAAASAVSGTAAETTASEAVYIGFAGDVHAETTGFDAWLGDVQAAYGDNFSFLSFAGDICDKSWVEETYTGFKAILDTKMPNAYCITTGNQEWKSGAPGASWDSLGAGHVRIGEAIATDDYIVYELGSAQESMIFPQEDIDALAAYLAAAPKDIPIFIHSHFPLHLSMATASHSIPGGDHRSTENSGALIDVLNQYPNVIFLWGHNHTFQDPRYGVISPSGSSFTYDYNNPTAKKLTYFTSAAYGSFCRGDTYAMVAKVQRTDNGVQVTLNYIDTDVPMTTKDSATLTITADGSVTADLTPGTGIDTNEILAMSGFDTDPDFETGLRG